MSPDSRYAIYYAPAATARLWHFAAQWLGRDPLTGDSLPPPPIEGFPQHLREAVIASPRRYGFHATLKPPFHLAPGRTEEDLLAAVTALASRQQRFAVPALQLATLGHFLALTLTQPSPEFQELADRCVRELDSFRRPPSPEELSRRQPDRLTGRQVELLHRWGYPYVFDQWQFHMTLTSSLSDEPTRAQALQYLAAALDPLAREPLVCDSICVFVQQNRNTPFLLRHRISFPA